MQIEKDLGRTSDGISESDGSLDVLRRLLLASCILFDFGYGQGEAFIAANALLVLRGWTGAAEVRRSSFTEETAQQTRENEEELAFELFVFLVSSMCPSYFDKQMSGLRRDVEVVKRMMPAELCVACDFATCNERGSGSGSDLILSDTTNRD